MKPTLQRRRRLPLPLARRLGLPFAALLGLAWLASALAARPAAAGDFFPPPRLTPAQAAYHHELVQAAAAQRLWESRTWHVLLHYRPNKVLPGVTSEADGLGFFLSRHGKVDPREELESTLARFFTTDALKPAGMTAQCTFPARYHWLKSQLHFDPQRLPEQYCKRFRAWREALDPGSVTLVYASYYFSVPASMFGHSLLRFDKKKRGESERLLDYGVNFAANVRADVNGMEYALKGLLGGFKGTYSMTPDYIKVREYADLETRDLWEYRLNLTPEQIDRLLAHTWEMGSTNFDYFFLDENCSYQLLTLLEVANPKLHLSGRFHAFAMPMDTIRAVLEQPGLVSSVTYRPSRTSQLNYKLSLLTPDSDAVLHAVLDDPDATKGPALAALPEKQQALLLEAAADYYQLQATKSQEAHDAVQPALRKVLITRSKIRLPPEAFGEPPRPPQPETGHRSSRMELALGATGDRHGFLDFTGQPGMHDLMADPTGYPDYSDAQVMSLRLRLEQVPDRTDPTRDVARLRLQYLNVVNMISLVPWSELEHPLSWRFHAGWTRLREGDLPCAVCTPLWVDGGVGMSWKVGGPLPTLFTVLAEPTLQVGHMFRDDYRLGTGLLLGALVDVAPGWRVGLLARGLHYFAGDKVQTVRSATLTQRIALGQNWDVRVDWSGDAHYREARLALGWFF